MKTDLVHASCVRQYGKAVLLLGDSGSGKSDLAIRLIDGGAELVADDQVRLHAAGSELVASCPETIRGMIEARGIGILTLPHAENAPVALAVNLVARGAVERLPEAQFFSCLGLQVPLLSLHAFDASTPAKIRLLLKQEG